MGEEKVQLDVELFVKMIFFLIGLCCGSFVNMLTYRTEVRYKLKKQNLKLKTQNKNRSFCDFCGNQLSWYENVPVVSWVWLSGKSRCCRKKLPGYYPLVEIIMGIIFLITNYELQITNYWEIGIHFIVITLLVFSAVFDMRNMILPDFSTFILVCCGLLLWFFNYWGDYSYLISGLGAGLFLLILHMATKGKGMGMGDVKYALFMGIILGTAKTILAFYLAFIGGAVVGVVLIILFGKKKNSRMPFGPFLIAATMISWYWGEKMLTYFYGWF